MSAEMFRLEGGQVVAGKGMTFFELPGTARKTLPASRGNYILGDNAGQGTMALIGDADEIEAWLDAHADKAIENRSDIESYQMGQGADTYLGVKFKDLAPAIKEGTERVQHAVM